MEKAIRKIFQSIISEPELKILLEDELNKYNKSSLEEDSDPLPELNINIALSRVLIDQDCRIFLTDYNNAEIDIQGYQAKTIYILHLLSPRGISNSNLNQYKELMKTIYMEICKHKLGDEYRAENMITGLLERKSGINDATNKIRKALQMVISDDQIFKYYVISGKRKGKRRILLPKDMVDIDNQALKQIKDTIIEMNIC